MKITEPLKHLCLLLALSSIFACSSKPVKISGDIFVATQGAGSYRLGSVKVIAITEKDFKNQVSLNEPQINTAKAKVEQRLRDCPLAKIRSKQEIEAATLETLEKWQAEAQCAIDAENLRRKVLDIIFAFKPKVESVSNADGKFLLTIPANESYVLLARATRKVGDTDEQYEWLEPIKVATTEQDIMLSNTNMKEPAAFLLSNVFMDK